MTKVLKGALLTLALVGFTGCVSTSDIQVDSMQSDKADLKGYKTYQFIEGSGIAEDTSKEVLMQNESASAEIEEIINGELAKKGKVAVSKDPDFFVAYLGGADMEAVKKKLDRNGKEIMMKSPEAALVLMLVDADSGSIIWMSTAEGEAQSKSHKEKKKRIEFTIQKMLKGI